MYSGAKPKGSYTIRMERKLEQIIVISVLFVTTAESLHCGMVYVPVTRRDLSDELITPNTDLLSTVIRLDDAPNSTRDKQDDFQLLYYRTYTSD